MYNKSDKEINVDNDDCLCKWFMNFLGVVYVYCFFVWVVILVIIVLICCDWDIGIIRVVWLVFIMVMLCKFVMVKIVLGWLLISKFLVELIDIVKLFILLFILLLGKWGVSVL